MVGGGFIVDCEIAMKTLIFHPLKVVEQCRLPPSDFVLLRARLKIKEINIFLYRIK